MSHHPDQTEIGASQCVSTHLCARPGCGRDAKRTRSWGKFCSSRCRFAVWDAAHPRQSRLNLEPQPTVQRTAALRSFHVRAHVMADEAVAGEQRALTQEDRILAWMRAHPGRWTPWDVSDQLGLCVNSARRACTNLTGRGLLVHHRGDRRPAGPYGQRSGTWEAA